MKLFLFGAAVAFVSAAQAAENTSQFDLVCSGMSSTKSLFENSSKPYSDIYRIDLQRKIWCDGECKATRDISDILPTELTLQSANVDTPSERSTLINSVDRQTGAHKITSTYSKPGDRRTIIIMDWAGQCEKRPFSGFPKFETKF